jgi:hypothetical protein
MTIKNFDGIANVSCVGGNDDDDDFIDEIMEHDIPYISSSSSDHQDEENMKITTHNQNQDYNNNSNPRTNIQTQTRTQKCCTIIINSLVYILCYIVSISAFFACFILLVIIIIGPQAVQ